MDESFTKLASFLEEGRGTAVFCKALHAGSLKWYVRLGKADSKSFQSLKAVSSYNDSLATAIEEALAGFNTNGD